MKLSRRKGYSEERGGSELSLKELQYQMEDATAEAEKNKKLERPAKPQEWCLRTKSAKSLPQSFQTVVICQPQNFS